MSKINSNIKDDFQVVLLLSCFMGHPVAETTAEILQTTLRSYLKFVHRKYFSLVSNDKLPHDVKSMKG